MLLTLSKLLVRPLPPPERAIKRRFHHITNRVSGDASAPCRPSPGQGSDNCPRLVRDPLSGASTMQSDVEALRTVKQIDGTYITPPPLEL